MSETLAPAGRKTSRPAPVAPTPVGAPPPPLSLTDGVLFAPATKEAAARVCVIADIGVNHDGRLDRALELVAAAARAGADAVATQLFDPRHLLSNQVRPADCTTCEPGLAPGQAGNVAFNTLDRLKLGLDELLAIRAAAHRAGLLFFVTPFSAESFDTLRRLNPDAIRIASADAVNYPLLRLVASLSKPMIIATGGAELEEIRFAAELFRHRSLHRPGPTLGCLMQSASRNAESKSDAGLGGLPVLAKRYGLPVGYSDHAADPFTGAFAVAAGACVIEKGLTYDQTAAGPDHAACMGPEAFAEYVAFVRRAAAMHGPLLKAVRPGEAESRSVHRQSVCFRHELPQGHVLTRSDLTVKRPGIGIPAARLDDVIGRHLARPVRANDLAVQDDLA